MRAFRAFSQAATDKGYVHGYDRYYDKLFKTYTPDSLLEIGVKGGRSLTAWRIMFPECSITGVDITDKEFSKRLIKFSQAKIVVEDATKPEIVNILDNNYDVIVDDGSHYYKDIIKSFKLLHNKFNKYYIIEDWHYDLDIAKKFLNKHGYHNVTFHLSSRSKMLVQERAIFKTKRKNLIKIDQNMIVIKR